MSGENIGDIVSQYYTYNIARTRIDMMVNIAITRYKGSAMTIRHPFGLLGGYQAVTQGKIKLQHATFQWF